MLFGSFVMYVVPGRAVSITSASYRAVGDAGYCSRRAGPVVGLGAPRLEEQQKWRASASRPTRASVRWPIFRRFCGMPLNLVAKL